MKSWCGVNALMLAWLECRIVVILGVMWLKVLIIL